MGNKPKKECDSCSYWTKWKRDPQGSGGLCDLLDVASRAQSGKICPQWKGKKHNRQSLKQMPS